MGRATYLFIKFKNQLRLIFLARIKVTIIRGHSGGLVVIVLAFYFDDPLKPEVFSANSVFKMKENQPKEAGVGP